MILHALEFGTHHPLILHRFLKFVIKGFLYGIPLLASFCSAPFQYLIQEFQTTDPIKADFEGKLLFIKNQNECFEYQIIVNTPLQMPFVPYQGFYSSDLELLEFHFLWIRIYIKNIGNDILTISRDKIIILGSKETFKPISIKELINLYSYEFYDKPLFWYTIPKKPILYFVESSKWFKNFFVKPNNPEDRKIKIDYYIKYFESFNKINLKKDEEVLFYLPFPHLYEDDLYTLNFHLNPCNVLLDFKYKKNLKQTPEMKGKEQDFFAILKELEKQNLRWKEQLDNELKKYQYEL